jgi:hypothetical protein
MTLPDLKKLQTSASLTVIAITAHLDFAADTALNAKKTKR